jgi:hypothetical protein
MKNPVQTGSGCIRFNDLKIENATLYSKNWAKRRIWTVNDLIDNQGNSMSFQDFQQTYNLRSMYFQFDGITLTAKKMVAFYWCKCT